MAAIGWLIRSIINLEKSVAAVQAQHVNNGGSTLRDAIDRIEGTVKALDDKVDAHLLVSAGDSALLKQHLDKHN